MVWWSGDFEEFPPHTPSHPHSRQGALAPAFAHLYQSFLSYKSVKFLSHQLSGSALLTTDLVRLETLKLMYETLYQLIN